MAYFRLLIFTIFFVLSSTFLSSANSQQVGERPVPISAPRPPYPALARAKRISGTVLVDVQVDAAEGKVTEANPVTGPEILRHVSKQAALGFRFKPLAASGHTYSVRLTYIFHEESDVEPAKKPDFTSPYQIDIWTMAEAF